MLGTQGGEPYWTDDANGTRDADEEVLLDADVSSGNLGAGGWYVGKIAVQGIEYAVDSRDYFLDFDLLVSAGLLKAAPESASTDNGGVSSGDGSYSWYIDANGNVESILGVFPYNGLLFDGTPIVGAGDTRGFIEGVYP